MEETGTWKTEIRGVVSILLFLAATAILFQDWQFSLLITSGLLVHELGHILAVRRLGLPWHLHFDWMGIGTETPLEARRRLSDYHNSLVHLAGPFFNLGFALLALGMHALLNPPGGGDYWLRLASFNALTAFINILPLGSVSDGGKFIKRIFSSLDERSGVDLLWSLAVWLVSLAWMLAVARTDNLLAGALLVAGLWLLLTMLVESVTEEPGELPTRRSQAMNPWQAAWLLAGLIVTLLASALILLQTPFWINEAVVYRMVAGWMHGLAKVFLSGDWQIFTAWLPWVALPAAYLVLDKLFSRLGRQMRKASRGYPDGTALR